MFNLIRRHNLFHFIADKVVLLMEFNEVEAVDMLKRSIDRLPVVQVMESLKNNERFQYLVTTLWVFLSFFFFFAVSEKSDVCSLSECKVVCVRAWMMMVFFVLPSAAYIQTCYYSHSLSRKPPPGCLPPRRL